LGPGAASSRVLGPRGFITLSLVGWIAVAGGAALLLSWGAVYVQTVRLDHAHDELKTIELAKQIQKQLTDSEIAKNAKLKKEKDDEVKRRLTAAAEFKRVFDARGGISLPPVEPAGSLDLACFDRPQFLAAINRFVADASRIAYEGDQTTIGIDTARGWIGELLRRQ
jgi:hypothetical protein